MSEDVLKIEKLENGYEVSVCDPDMMAANAKGKGAWQDPWKGYIFKTAAEVAAFVSEHLDSLKPPPDAEAEYKAGFNQQSEED